MSRFARWARALVDLTMLMPVLAGVQAVAPASQPGMQLIRVSEEGRRFVLSGSGVEFRPWGFNYDHDASNRLLETYWGDEWQSVAGDFREMKQLGANTVRIHLQVSSFMQSAWATNGASLKRLGSLVKLAEETGLYLDITGLGCYDGKEVPRWYDELDEEQRWEVQARFWEAVAEVCHHSAAVFCYDLMNEPVLSEDKQNRDWTPGEFAGRQFVQRLALDFRGRTPDRIAEVWIDKMVCAIRKHDSQHLITVGAIPWAMTWPTAKPVIYSKEASKNLDFVSLHFYPERDQVGKALKALAVYDIGKPIVIEEMFPLRCSVAQLDQFIDGSSGLAVGWIGFYWGKTIVDYKQGNGGIAEAITREWLEYFVRKTPEIQRGIAL